VRPGREGDDQNPLRLIGRGVAGERRQFELRDGRISSRPVVVDHSDLGDDDPPVEVAILDEEGRPVPSARVVVTGRRLGTKLETAADGVLRLGRRWLRDGGEIRVEAAMGTDGRALPLRPHVVPLQASDASRLELRLEPGRDLEVRVTDDDGAPVPKASVHVTSPDARADVRALFWNTPTWGNTDERGIARFVGLPRAHLAVSVEGDAGEAPLGRVEIGPSVLRADLGLRLGPSIQGVVLRDGAPVPNVAVEARGWDGGEVGRWSAATDSRGVFRIRGVPDGVEVRVEAQPEDVRGSRSSVVSGVRAGARDVVVTLEAAAEIRGRVVGRDGKTPSDWEVEAVPLDEGNEHGWVVGGHRWNEEFVLKGLRPGRYRVVGKSPQTSAVSRPLEVSAPAEGLKLVLEPAPRIHGRVEGVRGARYDAWWTTPTTKASARVNPDGTFEIGGVTDEDGTLYVGSLTTDRYALRTRVRPSDRPIELELVAGERVSGRVEIDGDAHPGLVYVVLAGDGFELWEEMAKDRTFTVLGVPPGSYEVSLAVNESRGPPQQRVRSGAEGVVLSYARR
jgi:hypothetical protein